MNNSTFFKKRAEDHRAAILAHNQKDTLAKLEEMLRNPPPELVMLLKENGWTRELTQ